MTAASGSARYWSLSGACRARRAVASMIVFCRSISPPERGRLLGRARAAGDVCSGCCSEWSRARSTAPRRRARRAARCWSRGRASASGNSSKMRPGLRLHHDDAVGERHRLLDVVGDDARRSAGSPPTGQQMLVQARAGEGVERRERLVEQQHLRVASRRRGRWRRAAAGRRRDRAASARHARRGRPCRARASTRARALGGGESARPKPTLSATREPGQQARLLEHDADGGMRLGDGLAVEADARRRSAGRGRRRGAAAWSCRSPSRRPAPTISPRATVEGDVGERARAVGIGLREALEGQHRVEPLPRRVLPAHERAASRRRAGCRPACRAARRR